MTSEPLGGQPPAADPRKPRIALMGEFSAGKSTLANILMREALSPVQITATQRPPIWYAHGDGPPVRIDMDGTETVIDAQAVNAAAIADTRAIRVFAEADILEACDIIDMPGSSDPNITLDIWQGMLPLADGVLWCSPATQAWRQSEAAMWEEAPPELQANSLLLLTRIDKILSAHDRQRLVRRVQGEAGAMFRAVLPVSLTEAQAAGEDPDLLRASGLEAVLESLLAIIGGLEAKVADPAQAAPWTLAAPAPLAGAEAAAGAVRRPIEVAPRARHPAAPDPAADTTARADGGPADAPAAATADAAREPAGPEPVRPVVMPRRVLLNAGDRTPRPRRAESGGSLI